MRTIHLFIGFCLVCHGVMANAQADPVEEAETADQTAQQAVESENQVAAMGQAATNIANDADKNAQTAVNDADANAQTAVNDADTNAKTAVNDADANAKTAVKDADSNEAETNNDLSGIPVTTSEQVGGEAAESVAESCASLPAVAIGPCEIAVAGRKVITTEAVLANSDVDTASVEEEQETSAVTEEAAVTQYAEAKTTNTRLNTIINEDNIIITQNKQKQQSDADKATSDLAKKTQLFGDFGAVLAEAPSPIP